MPLLQLDSAAAASSTVDQTQLNFSPYQSEEVASFEIGMRSNPTDNSQLNVTYFSADYSLTSRSTVIVPMAMTQSVAKVLLKIQQLRV